MDSDDYETGALSARNDASGEGGVAEKICVRVPLSRDVDAQPTGGRPAAGDVCRGGHLHSRARLWPRRIYEYLECRQRRRVTAQMVLNIFQGLLDLQSDDRPPAWPGVSSGVPDSQMTLSNRWRLAVDTV